jgi:hypothetical protein
MLSSMKDAGEPPLSARERKRLLRAVDREAARLSRAESRHLRGVGAVFAVAILLFGGELVALWKAGALADMSRVSGSAFRGLGMIAAAQIALLAWIYRRFSRPRGR